MTQARAVYSSWSPKLCAPREHPPYRVRNLVIAGTVFSELCPCAVSLAIDRCRHMHCPHAHDAPIHAGHCPGWVTQGMLSTSPANYFNPALRLCFSFRTFHASKNLNNLQVNSLNSRLHKGSPPEGARPARFHPKTVTLQACLRQCSAQQTVHDLRPSHWARAPDDPMGRP